MSAAGGVELAAIVTVFAFTVWVLVVQPIALVRAMPRPTFVGFQMKVVRAWVRTLIPLTALVAAMATVRSGLSAAIAPAVAALAGSIAAGAWAIPRALRAGGESLRVDSAEVTSGSFLSQGGGDRTRVWHRVVLGCVLVVFGGLVADAHGALGHSHHHDSVDVEAPIATGARTPVDRATGDAIRELERRTAAMVAVQGQGDPAELHAAWDRIFAVCTMEGEAHERLHRFLAPLAAHLEGVGAEPVAERLPHLRAMLARLAAFDAEFVIQG